MTDSAGQTPLHHAVAEGHGIFNLILLGVKYPNKSIGDTAVALLKAGAETDKKDVDGYLALDLAPDPQVRNATRIRDYLLINDPRSGSSYCKVRTEKA